MTQIKIVHNSKCISTGTRITYHHQKLFKIKKQFSIFRFLISNKRIHKKVQRCQSRDEVEEVREIDYKEYFNGEDGVPIVKERVSYGRLLRDIREWKVRKIHWFKDEENDFYIQGPCIVEYRDGHVKHSHVPHHDLRVPTAMQYFNVEGLMLKPIPQPHLLNPPKLVSDEILDIVGKVSIYLSNFKLIKLNFNLYLYI